MQAIQEMSGALAVATATEGPPQPGISAQERAQQIFSKMDTDGNGILDEKEFVLGCLADSSLVQMLVLSGNLA
jgi:hypothetical protein